MVKRIKIDDQTELQKRASAAEIKSRLQGKPVKEMKLAELAELVLLLSQLAGLLSVDGKVL